MKGQLSIRLLLHKGSGTLFKIQSLLPSILLDSITLSPLIGLDPITLEPLIGDRPVFLAGYGDLKEKEEGDLMVWKVLLYTRSDAVRVQAQTLTSGGNPP